MTEMEAKKILLEKIHIFTSKDFPLTWVGKLIEETEAEYIFEACPYAEGEKPENEAAPVGVNKLTGDVFLRIPIG